MVWHDSVPATCVKFFGLGQALGYGFNGVDATWSQKTSNSSDSTCDPCASIFDATGLALTLIGSND